MRNVELKCRCGNLEAVRARAVALEAREEGVLVQEDTFYPAPRGRLKLRRFPDGSGELIAYRRADAAEARASNYLIFPTPDAAGLGEVLAEALGEAGTVRKRRRLLLYENTRIHLDVVEGLGTFVELETVLRGQSEEDAHSELARVARALALRAEDAEERAYVDLL